MPSGDSKRGSGSWGPAGATRGVCMVGGDHPARNARAFYCDEHKPTAENRPAPEPVEAPPAPADSNGAGEIYADSERAPTVPESSGGTKGFFGKLWKGGGEAQPNGKHDTAPVTTERKPIVARRRVSTASFWGDLLGPVSAVVARSGDVPVARAMQWSAPVAGDIIEDATRGTFVDGMIQPIVRNSEKWADLFDLMGFWAGIAVAERSPAQAPAALAFARSRLVNLLPRIATTIKKQRAKEAQAVEALTELMPDLKELFPDAGPDDDPVALLIQTLFAAPPTMMQEEAANA
jgi:hypothetical protein